MIFQGQELLEDEWFRDTDPIDWSKLKRYARAEDGLQGMYLPYWTYDAQVTSRYTGQRGDHYHVNVGSGKNRRRVRKTRWRPAAGM